MDKEARLDDTTLETLTDALRHPRGRYLVDRAAQLSGIPRSTLYEWRRSKIYVPDFDAGNPVTWSYRDLILLRLLAFLRQGDMPRSTAAVQVRRIKSDLEQGKAVRRVFATRESLIVEPEPESRTGGNLLPYDDVFAYVRVFDLHHPVDELGGPRSRLWGPDLIRPSRLTAISPVVLAGDPCVERTRIQTSSLYVLATDRGLDPEGIVGLYPDISIDAVIDAIALERRLRGLEQPEPVAA